MLKRTLIIMTLLAGFSFGQDMPGLGVYVGGVYGTASGPVFEDLSDGVEIGYQPAGPMLGVSYATMVSNFPLFVGAGLGARSFKLTHDDSNSELTSTFQYFDMWATMPYPINDNMNLYGGILLGMPLNNEWEECIDGDCEEWEDEELPEGLDMNLLFGLGYGLPVMDGALSLNMGFALGLAEINYEDGDDDGAWKHSGFFMSLNYDIPGM